MNLNVRRRFAALACLLAFAAACSGSAGTTVSAARPDTDNTAGANTDQTVPTTTATTATTVPTTTTTVPPTTVTTTLPTTEFVVDGDGVEPGTYDAESFNGRPCSELYVNGEPVYVYDDKRCIDENGAEVFLITDIWYCTNSPLLWSDELGWGYLGSASHRKAPGELLDVQEVISCTGTTPQAPPRH